MSLRLLYSGFKWDHHDARSGYHHVVASPVDYIDGARLPGGTQPDRSLGRRLNMLLIDLVTAVRGIRYDCVLIFYPEQTVYISPAILKLFGVRVMYAVHLDEHYWFERNDSVFLRLKRWNTRFVDHFIVLSQAHHRAFSRRFPEKVTFIPHGLWTKPAPSDETSRRKSIVVVGDNYRDYDLMGRAIDHFARKHPEVEFDLVGVNASKLRFDQRPGNFIAHGRLSSEVYNELVETCCFMFIPLTFATANNALLEGIASGVPVVCNKIDGARDYLEDECIVESVEQLSQFYRRRAAMTVDELAAERARIVEMGRARFGWARIQNQVSDLARRVCAA